MIDALRGWMTSVIAASFLIAAAQSLAPEGTLRRIAGFVGGLALILTLARPLLGADLRNLNLGYDGYAGEIQRRQEELQAESDRALGELIAEDTEAYILDKAAELGLDVTVRVLTEPGEDGVPVPAGAELTGRRAEALADYLERELGISRERQVYHGAE